MRQKIGNALKARSEAIKKALKEYNQLAVNLSPPCEQLTWAKVVEMATVGDFDLLQHTCQDIRDFPWAQNSTREAIRIYLNLQRAEEECTRLNIEANCLLTTLYDTHVDLSAAIAHCEDPLLFVEFCKWYKYHTLTSEKIASSLLNTSKLPGFTGTLSISRRIGRSPTPHCIPSPSWINTVSFAKDGDSDDTDIMDGLVEFFDTIEL
jgi:hypothetical protein